MKNGEEMVLYVVHGNTYYEGYGHVESIFGIYTEKKNAETAKDLVIQKLYEKNKDDIETYVEDIEDIEVDIAEIDANELVNIELGGYYEWLN